MLDMSHNNIYALDAHLLRVQHIGAEAVVGYDRVRVLLRRFDEFFECWLRLLFVRLEQLWERDMLDALLASILEHSAT